MKKLLYVLLIAFVSSMTITACTDDSVKPTVPDPSHPGGGDEVDPFT